MSNPLLQAKEIAVIKGGAAILNTISVAIHAGSAHVIMGHNGAGKTMLLYALHGLVEIASGSREMTAGLGQKLVFQKPVLLRRSAAAHFAFASGITARADMMAWFHKADLADKCDVPARQLSAGEQQKLALISALATQPDILFLDEPTANLDRDSTKAIEAMITAAKQDGTALVMVSHSVSQAKRLADRIWYLEEGQLCDDEAAAAFFGGAHSAQADRFLAET